MNLFQEAKKVLDKDGKVNPLGPYGKQKLTGREVSTYFRNNKVKDAKLRKAVEVALDLGGAMNVASSEIKKFYGDKILKSKEVQNALKYANESVEFSLDMINEDEIRVDHENPKDRGDQKKFRKIIQLGKQAKIKLLDGGGRGYRAQGNKSQVQKFKQLVSKEFGKSVSFNEDAEAKAKLALKHAQDRKRLKAQQKTEKERLSMGEATTNMPDNIKNKLSMLRNKRMDVPHGSPEYVRMGKEIDQIMTRYARKLNNEVEKVKENIKFNEFDTIRKMWEDSLEKKNLKESSMFGYGAGDKQSASDDSYVINQRAKDMAKRQGKVWSRMSYGDQEDMRDKAYKAAGWEKHGSKWMKPGSPELKRQKDFMKQRAKEAEIERNKSPKEKLKDQIEKLEKQRDHFDAVAQDAYDRADETGDEDGQLYLKGEEFEERAEEINKKIRDLEDKLSGMKESVIKEVSLGDNMLRKDFPNVWASKDAKLYRVLSQLISQDGFVDNAKAYKKNPKDYLNRLRDIAKNPKKYEKSFGRNFSQYINNPKPGQNYAKLPESINEVTDKEINMAKKLSKDMEKVKKGYQQIAKTGDKTLKSTGFNATYESILKAQQKVLSLIGELTTMKTISDRAASRKKDAQGRPIMSSNIMDSYRIMHEESMQDKLSKLFKMRDKKAIDGVANLLNMTSVKVLQSMQKQNPKGFERMAKKMGELPAMEGKEIIDEKLSREDLKLIDKMYDKKGNLTPIGKKVMEYGKKKKK